MFERLKKIAIKIKLFCKCSICLVVQAKDSDIEKIEMIDNEEGIAE